MLAHVGAGVALRLLRRSQNLRRYYGGSDNKHPVAGAATHTSKKGAAAYSGWPALSYISASGYVFSAVFATHVFMNRVLPLAVEGDSANVGLAYVAHGFARHGAVSWLAYAVLLTAGCGHMVWGWAKWVGLAQGAGWTLERRTGNVAVDRAARKSRRRRLMLVNAVAAAATAVWAAGGLGIVARGGETLGWVGKLYDGLYAKVPMF